MNTMQSLLVPLLFGVALSGCRSREGGPRDLIEAGPVRVEATDGDLDPAVGYFAIGHGPSWDGPLCSGVLVAPDRVLTSAFCLDALAPPSAGAPTRLGFGFGAVERGVVVPVARSVSDPSYVRGNPANAMAGVVLERPVVGVKPIPVRFDVKIDGGIAVEDLLHVGYAGPGKRFALQELPSRARAACERDAGRGPSRSLCNPDIGAAVFLRGQLIGVLAYVGGAKGEDWTSASAGIDESRAFVERMLAPAPP